LDSGFDIAAFGDMTYDEAVVLIQYEGKRINLIDPSQGIDQLKIKTLTNYIPSDFTPRFKLSDFLLALDKALKFFRQVKIENL